MKRRGDAQSPAVQAGARVELLNPARQACLQPNCLKLSHFQSVGFGYFLAVKVKRLPGRSSSAYICADKTAIGLASAENGLARPLIN